MSNNPETSDEYLPRPCGNDARRAPERSGRYPCRRASTHALRPCQQRRRRMCEGRRNDWIFGGERSIHGHVRAGKQRVETMEKTEREPRHTRRDTKTAGCRLGGTSTALPGSLQRGAAVAPPDIPLEAHCMASPGPRGRRPDRAGTPTCKGAGERCRHPSSPAERDDPAVRACAAGRRSHADLSQP